MAGYKTFGSEVLTSDDVNEHLMRQSVIRIANQSELDAIPTPEAGMMAYRADNATTYRHNGTTWVGVIFPSGWVDLTVNSGFTAVTTPQVKRVGDLLVYRGRVDKNSGNYANTDTPLNAPLSHTPSVSDRAAVSGSTGAMIQLSVSSGGPLSLSGTPTSSGNVLFLGGLTMGV